MTVLLFVLGLALIGLIIAFGGARGLTYLMFFQQEEYDTGRFLPWWWRQRAFDRLTSLVALVAMPIPWATDYSLAGLAAYSLLLTVGLALGIWRSRTLMRLPKKPLVMTRRARRIFAVYLGLWLLAMLLVIVPIALLPLPDAALSILILAQLPPVILVAANALLAPAERRIKARFRREAEAKLHRLAPTVIGITGSFGKTSTKHLLAHVLAGADQVLATPGSVNTPMGITRVIREDLTDQHRYFVVEMGAYGPGSIANLCRLAPPDLSIVTAVGPAHYERFKSLEAVFDTKFEIADAAARRGGKTIVAADGVLKHKLDDRLQRDDNLILVGRGEACALRLIEARVTADGLAMTVQERGGAEQQLSVPLYGRHQIDNILCTIAAARELGLPFDLIKAALATQPQVRHRLEVFRSADRPTIVDDAYNSNPTGFEAALESLDALVAPGGRRILVTPGMVELGAKHDEEHARLGEKAADHVDIALVVTPERIPTFVEALQRSGPTVQVTRYAAQAEAERWVADHAKPGDVVLYENNLPDLYEARPRF
ncbi:MAG: Mur ligase family protein [Rhodothalassiaceae bacterium]